MKRRPILKALLIFVVLIAFVMLTAETCEYDTNSSSDSQNQLAVSKTLEETQPTPTDINYSLERFNLIRRAYWVNGQREKALSLPCPISNPPLGYIIKYTQSGAILGMDVVEGKLSDLNSYLTPESEFYEITTGSTGLYRNKWLADVDGSYGANSEGVFYFTPDGIYHEYKGYYEYTDQPVKINTPSIITEVK